MDSIMSIKDENDRHEKHRHEEGGCQCGAVRYRTTNQPARAMACHCITCRLRTGSPYGVGVYFDEKDVEFLQGEMSVYKFNSDTSDRWVRNEFCLRCGTAVSWTLEMRPGLRAIAGGTFDNPDWYPIQAHIWTRSAKSDMCYPDGIPQHEKSLSG
ncbi:MAG: GFA family protein [Gammaproteobacteria bacterium]|nr:GFA family protein [Gammaproteobacteria bacterium]